MLHSFWPSFVLPSLPRSKKLQRERETVKFVRNSESERLKKQGAIGGSV